MHASQRQPSRARWKLAGFWDTDLWLGTPISVQPQPYWISPWKCLFLSLSHQDASLPLISSLFIKGSPWGVTSRSQAGRAIEAVGKGKGRGWNIQQLQNYFLHLWSWWHKMAYESRIDPSVLHDCHWETSIQFPFFSSIWLTPTTEPERTHQVCRDCSRLLRILILCKLSSVPDFAATPPFSFGY